MANKILLIEDDAAIIDVYETAFKAAKIDVETITWGRQALEKVKEMQAGKVEKPSLVLLDLILPDINGSEILNAIKKNEATKDILVFVLSNYADKNPDPDRAKPDKFILKTDIAPTELANLVKKVLK